MRWTGYQNPGGGGGGGRTNIRQSGLDNNSFVFRFYIIVLYAYDTLINTCRFGQWWFLNVYMQFCPFCFSDWRVYVNGMGLVLNTKIAVFGTMVSNIIVLLYGWDKDNE